VEIASGEKVDACLGGVIGIEGIQGMFFPIRKVAMNPVRFVARGDYGALDSLGQAKGLQEIPGASDVGFKGRKGRLVRHSNDGLGGEVEAVFHHVLGDRPPNQVEIRQGSRNLIDLGMEAEFVEIGVWNAVSDENDHLSPLRD
jgi:hypothetical protein